MGVPGSSYLMKSIMPGILMLTLGYSLRCQSHEFDQYPGGVIVEAIGWYKNPLPACEHLANGNWRLDSDRLVFEKGLRQPLCLKRVQDEFVYRVKVRNNGAKVIAKVDWDYIVIDSVANLELGRRQFTSAEKISAHHHKSLTEYASAPPTRMVNVSSFVQRDSNRIRECVLIRQVTFEDGWIWRPPRDPISSP
jgi:hypothetical protein